MIDQALRKGVILYPVQEREVSRIQGRGLRRGWVLNI